MLRHYIYQLLTESLNSVIASNPHIPEDIIRSYHQNALPKNNKADKLLNFILKLHKQGQVSTNDNSELQRHLSILHNSNQLSKLKDIHSFTSLKELTKGVDDNKALTKKEVIDKDSPVVFENEHIIIRQHLNHPSAVKAAILQRGNPYYHELGGKAEWCVSANSVTGKGHFSDYVSNGNHPMYTIHNKKTKEQHALVANPTYNLDDVELRDEKDNKVIEDEYDAHAYLIQHKGIEHTPVGKYILGLAPIVKSQYDKLPSNATGIQIENNPYSAMRVNHPNILPSHFTTWYNQNDPIIQRTVLLKHNIPSSILHKAVLSKNPIIRKTTLEHRSLKPEHLDTAVKKGNTDIVKDAIQSPLITPIHLNTILQRDDLDFDSQYLAMIHPKADDSTLQLAVSNINPTIREASAHAKNINKEQLKLLTNDSDSDVSKTASRVLSRKFPN